MVYFNPRPREGSDIFSRKRCTKHQAISIHAPARGATAHLGDTEGGEGISIHAPARGATRMDRVRRTHRIFQSTLPRGERRCSPVTTCMWQYFNPRSREGSDGLFTRDNLYVAVFQSTLPRGERLNLLYDYVTAYSISIHAPARGATTGRSLGHGVSFNFNPRSREGSDKLVD